MVTVSDDGPSKKRWPTASFDEVDARPSRGLDVRAGLT
jgi:hypothetical protein